MAKTGRYAAFCRNIWIGVIIYCVSVKTYVRSSAPCSTSVSDENLCRTQEETGNGSECRFECCDGWALDSNGNCTISLPPNYHKPHIAGCPRTGESITVEIGATKNIGYLSRGHFHAYDWENKALYIFLSKSIFTHCKCSKPYEQVIATSGVDQYGNKAECQFQVYIKDRYPPKFENCPEDQLSMENEVIIWNEPLVEDNVGVKTLTPPDYLNNSIFEPGVYELKYTATDFSSNDAICSFTVSVEGPSKATECTTPSNNIATTTILAAFSVILVVLSITLFGLFRRRRRKRNRECHTNSHVTSSTDSRSSAPEDAYSVYQIQNRVPPPYDSTMYNKPPDYNQTFEPPSYDECVQIDPYVNTATYTVFSHVNTGCETQHIPRSSQNNIRSETCI